jgi:hypothetical protein
VRWEQLFSDLEGQYAEANRQELAAEVADRTRRETARIHLAHRTRLAIGAELRVGLGAAGDLAGLLSAAGPDWLLIRPSAGSECLVAEHAVGWLSGLPGVAEEPEAVPVVESRLDLRYVLRGIARDRSPVVVDLRDGTRLTGTIDRVGADFLDLALHASGEARRPSSLLGVRTVSLAAVAVVRAV